MEKTSANDQSLDAEHRIQHALGILDAVVAVKQKKRKLSDVYDARIVASLANSLDPADSYDDDSLQLYRDP